MLKQNLQLKLSQKLSPQQIQLMKMLQLPTLAFEQRIKQEMEENPALESDSQEDFQEENFDDEFDNSQEDYEERDIIQADDINVDEYLSDDEIPEYRLHSNNYSDDDTFSDLPFRAEVSFYQSLINQLNTFRLSDEQWDIAEFLIGSINDNGYIRRETQDIVDDLAFTQNIYTDEASVEKVFQSVIFQLDPAGIGARTLQECLIIQLERKTPTAFTSLAIEVLKTHFDLFSKKHYDKLAQKMHLSEEDLRKVITEIERLNPKPGSSYTENTPTEQIVPDFTIRVVDEELELLLNDRNVPHLYVSKEYTQMLETYRDTKDKSSQKEAVQFIKQKLDAAKWFIDAVKQRQHTLYITMYAIMEHQKEYFLSGDELLLKPLILKDIAAAVGMDVSTISRVVSSKYVNTPYGTKLLKEFFSEAMKNEQGEDVSTLQIKEILQNVIAQEDKSDPLTDDQLTQILKEKGYPIARRTIAKYREQLDIPVARLRKKL